MATTLDTLQVEIRAITGNFNREIDGVKGKLSELGETGQQSNQQMMAGFDKVGAAATKALKWGVVGAIAAVAASIPGAVKRIDTLNNAPKVLQNLGYAARDTEPALKKLDAGIRGLPTSLDEATSSLVSIASASGKTISEATDLTLAFNNMALAGGKGPAEAQRAFVQFTQAVGRGKMGVQEFNTLAEVMPAQLAQVAKSLLGPTANAATLRDAFSDGTVTMDDFMNEIMKLDKQGGEGFASFAVQAKDATAGIGTGFANMRIAITRGVTAIMDAIGSANISDALSTIGKAFGTALLGVAALITFVAAHSDVFAPLAVGIGVAVAAILAYNTYVKISAVVTAAWSAASTYLTLVASLQAQGLGILRAAWMALNIMMAANPIGIVIVAIVAITAALIYFFTQTETGKRVFENAMNAIRNAAQNVWNWISSNWPLLLAILTGPIGIAVLVIVRNIDTIKAAFSSAMNFVKGVWSGAPGFFSGVVNGIIGAISSIPSRFANMFRQGYSAVTSIDWAGLGRAIINGIANGLNPGVIVGRMKDMASSALAAAKDMLNIRSPSRVMRDEVGKMMGLGVAEGIEASTGVAVKSALSSAKSIMSAYDLTSSLPTTSQLSGRLSVGLDTRLAEIDARPMHVTVKVGEDTLVDKIIGGINDRTFLTGDLVINA